MSEFRAASAVEVIDGHLAGLPADRKLISVDEHVDVLLDVRNAVLTTQPDTCTVSSVLVPEEVA